jgi:branched-chain amino acid aminotransferase
MSDYYHPSVISAEEAVSRLRDLERPGTNDYLAMYSTWLDGIVRDPWLMSVPLDDHLVHRGDGVFEVSKCIHGRIYQLRRHLARLERSAASIHLDLPCPLSTLERLAVAVARAGGEPDCMVRIYASRGPGGFTTNPYECSTPGLYVMAGRIHPPKPEAYQRGVTVGISQVPAKSGFFANVKSCNYLPNVLLKREAVIKGWDFALGLDENGFLAEGSTENFGLVDQDGRMLLPPMDHILEGITLGRVIELAREISDQGGLPTSVEIKPLTVTDILEAREMMLFGTTLDVLPVTRLEEHAIGEGRPGPVARMLLDRLTQDILENTAASTPAFD